MASLRPGAPVTALVAGERYVATTTAKRAGKRFFCTLTFTAARSMTPEPFIRGSATTPDQDRVFRVLRGDSAPELVVTGSIRAHR